VGMTKKASPQKVPHQASLPRARRFFPAAAGWTHAGEPACSVRSTAARWRGDGLAPRWGRGAIVSTTQERCDAMLQALANTRIAGHEPTPRFLEDVAAVVEGTMTYDQAIRASAARASDQDGIEHPET